MVKIVNPEGEEMTNYYSTESGLLIATVKIVETPQGKMPDETGFSNYKDVNGIKLAHSMLVSAGPRKLTFELNEAEINGKVDKDSFSLE